MFDDRVRPRLALFGIELAACRDKAAIRIAQFALKACGPQIEGAFFAILQSDRWLEERDAAPTLLYRCLTDSLHLLPELGASAFIGASQSSSRSERRVVALALPALALVDHESAVTLASALLRDDETIVRSAARGSLAAIEADWVVPPED